ncbi:hypothetical protein [Kribbella catacumbae]|uniref:hypothetical protein n=1 Tax=Kribbella catacumbae TaxID=460086 RepID=UPI00039C1E33|nr:hypothetical protein [Kribbella catacumbae]
MRRFVVGVSALALLAGLGSVPAVASTAADARVGAACAYERLALPEGHSWASRVLAADQTGRHLIGQVRHVDGTDKPVLWTDGQPQWLIPEEGLPSQTAEAVTNDGRVVGSTLQKDYSRTYWIYQAGTYQPLAVPAELKFFDITSINNRGDLVGYGWDDQLQANVPLVRPAGGEWQRLPNPGAGDARKISDEGLVIGMAGPEYPNTGVVWDSWTTPPRKLPGKTQETTQVKDIRGEWIVGYEAIGAQFEFRGFRWPTNGEPAVSFEGYDIASVNRNGDLATATGPTADGSTVIRRDGSEITFPIQTDLRHLFDRGEKYTAAGYIGTQADPLAVVWKDCGL